MPPAPAPTSEPATGRLGAGRRARHIILTLLATVTALFVLATLQEHAPGRQTAAMSVEWQRTGRGRTVTGVLLDPSGGPVSDRVVYVRGASRWTRADGPTRSGQFHVDAAGLVVTGVRVTPGDTVEWPRYWCPPADEGLHLTVRLKAPAPGPVAAAARPPE